MSKGPVPSNRCLLSKLPACQVGDKVRFLGCVQFYSNQSAILSLRHSFPPGSDVVAGVDVNLLLKSLNKETDIGQWVHVIGYVTSIRKSEATPVSNLVAAKVGVQAIVLWTAEDVDLVAYEGTFDKT